ncbi:hypothetical protein JCM10449v2_002716 [Rhodotorula kratochvilovae]
MALPIVLNSQLPSALRRRDSMFSNPDTDDDELEPVSTSRPSTNAYGRQIAMLESMLGGTSLGGLPGLCTCGSCPECRESRRQRRRDRKQSLRDPIMKPLKGPASPSPDYLRRAAAPSRPAPSAHPLLVISLDGVVDARLPYHLSGGYTDVLARPYLEPFLAYLLSQQSPWSFCFYSSLPREQALETLKCLNMPTGGPEKDERDGVVGLFARDDMREGWEGGELELKDLDVIWSELYEEEGVQWGVEDTVVLTDFPGHMKKQPANYILVPQLTYKSTTRPRDDQFLLLMIAVLKDLETETNFAYHIKEMDWASPQIWNSMDEHSTNERNGYLLNAVRICADYRIDIKAFSGNQHA